MDPFSAIAVGASVFSAVTAGASYISGQESSAAAMEERRLKAEEQIKYLDKQKKTLEGSLGTLAESYRGQKALAFGEQGEAARAGMMGIQQQIGQATSQSGLATSGAIAQKERLATGDVMSRYNIGLGKSLMAAEEGFQTQMGDVTRQLKETEYQKETAEIEKEASQSRTPWYKSDLAKGVLNYYTGGLSGSAENLYAGGWSGVAKGIANRATGGLYGTAENLYAGGISGAAEGIANRATGGLYGAGRSIGSALKFW